MSSAEARYRSDGFTLLEVMIAISILCIGILGVASMQITSTQGNEFAGDTTEGATVAQRKLEQFQMVSYSNASLQDITPVGTVTTYVDPLPPAGYTVTWTVDADNPITNTKRIAVTVQWQNRGQTRSTTLISYKKMDVL